MSETLKPLSKLARSIVIGGIYEHYKKKTYKVLGVARHSETLEELVVYQALYGDKDMWVRPVAMFLEMITVNNQSVARFKLIS